MKILLNICFLVISLTVCSQDKIYLLNGECVFGKVLEISPSTVKYETEEEDKSIEQHKILLIEFKNGSVEVLNSPEKDIVSSNDKNQTERIARNSEEFSNNFFSVNTLALCNADVSGFYEKILKNKVIGVGLMAAYNFNVTSSISNVFISILGNAKKNYDLGCFVNLYPGGFKKKTTMNIGIFMKYTDFSFSRQTLTSGIVKYSPAKGSQLATLLCLGTHTKLVKNFFIKTLFGLGGFTVRGAYKEQLNFRLNSPGGGNTGPPVNAGFLPKIYLGLNTGFCF